jgi:rhamnosyltransferase
MSATFLTAVIVTYNPDLHVLNRLVDKCITQADAVVIVDNGNGTGIKPWLEQKAQVKLVLLTMGENHGVAAAQNAGIAWARMHGASYVLLFDQDSTPEENLAARLQSALITLEKTNEKIAAVGPRYLDSRWNKEESFSPFSRFQHGRIAACHPPTGSAYVSVDFLISSGSLISMKALDAVGNMDEKLFIDYVDVEWCARAKAKGWNLYGVWDVVMEHDLGDDRAQALGRSIAIRNPNRHYYALRNAAWLCVHSPLPCSWKLAIALQGMGKFIAYSVFMPKPIEHVRFMSKGLWHGLTRQMGRLPD